ncbi:MAG: YbjN domain-containing protein [Candidatus Hodarchaeota archaeon]
MKLEDFKVLLVQNLGLDVKDHEDFLTSTWKISEKYQKQLVFYIDDQAGLITVSTRLDEEISEDIYKKLLHLNLKLSLVKFCMDKEDNLMVLGELPVADFSVAFLKRVVYGVYKSIERFYEVFKES